MGIRIALAGNPNCGKTTMFNDLTGASQYVGNWPGVTVEKKEGKYTRDKNVIITDLPGVYSLSPYSPEEIVTRDYLLDGGPDVVVNLVDATNLERNLYLTTQILDLGVPVVVALNMMDLVKKSGDKIDVDGLSKRLGCPVVETTALRGHGMAELMETALKAARAGKPAEPQMPFDAQVEEAIAKIEGILGNRVSPATARWFAIKLFEGEERTIAAMRLGDAELKAVETIREEVEDKLDDDVESIVTSERYNAITHVVDETMKRSRKGMTTTQKIDRVVTNRWLGLPIFVVVMALVYYLAISVGTGVVTDWANDGISGDGFLYTGGAAYEEAVGAWEESVAAAEEAGASEEELALLAEEKPDASDGSWGLWIPGLGAVIGNALEAADVAPWLQSLVMNGIVAGVGAVIGFVPQMVILFLLLALLEGCGYLARVAFIMDRVFRRFGLSGKSFIPMLVASGCGVPAVTATKTIENEKDRRMTIMTTTMIPCGAKMPIIALVFGAIAGGNTEATWWIAPLFYFLGVIAIIVSGIMLKKTRLFAGPASPFVMELPSYHMPTAKSVLMSTWDRIKGYLVKAGTIIFLSTIVIWLLMNFGDAGEGFGLLDTEADNYIQYSLMAGLGNAIGWVFAPLGFGDWQATVTSVTGLVAKENVVATVGILTSLGDAGETDPAMWAAFAALFAGSVPAILAFCAFNLLCAPCFAAIGTIWREMGTAKWTWFTIGYMTVFAWCVGLMFYQFGGLITGEVTFNLWTGVAIAVLAGMLFQIFRPMPSFDKKKDKVSGKLEAEGNVA
ncbi:MULTISPECIES: ferrous iron transporter B [Eggerthella]|uniref:ferrous iron transporter B n=1 Tax=Eggerthella TaxID=84111 RepID=UPI00136C30BB|nr:MULTISPECIES: ferrous iron transporter B [Eggerthella]MCC2784054.1 ferrous iron transporter B [Eggerthella lenta]MCQ4797221.1 ferrous iron transporter B [Eggerthella lenta]MDB1778853.1 ferrous iron transporter B [Eggerthella lenta]MDU5064534.1 ferrous iron transporter B [Eggerthella sp.]MDU5257141.1 ferrous iron transporter B [Eggerthella sp.]